jgi:hypothetical protein
MFDDEASEDEVEDDLGRYGARRSGGQTTLDDFSEAKMVRAIEKNEIDESLQGIVDELSDGEELEEDALGDFHAETMVRILYQM